MVKYSDLPYENLRSMLLNGELQHEHMSEEDYAFLIDNETELDNLDSAVIDFCTVGLARFTRYKKCESVHVDIEKIFVQAQSRKKPRKSLFSRKPKRSVVVFAVLASFLAITVAAAAMGFNIIDLAKKLFNIQDKSADDAGITMFSTEDARFYISFDEMLKSENLSILEPVNLPSGYYFTVFAVIDYNSHLAVKAYASVPYLTFTVEVGTEQKAPRSYSYETNGIKYNISEKSDGLYQADWHHNNDYYSIVVDNKAILSEIINNLK